MKVGLPACLPACLPARRGARVILPRPSFVRPSVRDKGLRATAVFCLLTAAPALTSARAHFEHDEELLGGGGVSWRREIVQGERGASGGWALPACSAANAGLAFCNRSSTKIIGNSSIPMNERTNEPLSSWKFECRRRH